MALLWLIASPLLVLPVTSFGAETVFAPRNQLASVTNRTFAEWKAACDRLPSNRALRGRLPPRQLLPLQRFAEVDAVLNEFFALCRTGALSQASHWVGGIPGHNTFFNTDRAHFMSAALGRESIPFEPFAQKLTLPPDSEVFVRADLHGDVHSLIANLSWLNERGYLNGFQIAHTNFHMLFLGDYTDRGVYGVEVLYTLLRLKLANPDRVFLARGNHEEVSLQSRYGFFQEGQAKYGNGFNARAIGRACDFLPVVIYLGTGGNFIQCNHGGMEPGYRPQSLLEAPGEIHFQLLGTLEQKRFLAENPGWFGDKVSQLAAKQFYQNFKPTDPMTPNVLGFMWNDFTVLAGEPPFAEDTVRAYVYGKPATEALLRAASSDKAKVHAVFRGHQHSGIINPMMRRLVASQGVFRHWQSNDAPALLDAPVTRLKSVLEQGEVRSVPTGSVWTFNVGPDSVYGQGCDFAFDSFGLLKLAPEFADWRLRVVNLPVKF